MVKTYHVYDRTKSFGTTCKFNHAWVAQLAALALFLFTGHNHGYTSVGPGHE